MSSCEVCGVKNGCECPESLRADLDRIEELERQLAISQKLYAKALEQRNEHTHDEWCDGQCFVNWDAELKAIAEGK